MMIIEDMLVVTERLNLPLREYYAYAIILTQ